MGRSKKVLTDEEIIQVEGLAAYLTTEQIADYFSVHKDTFNELRKRNEEISRRYKRGKAKAIAKIAQSLVKSALAGDSVSRIFYLKTQAGWSDKQQIEGNAKDVTPQLIPQIFEVNASTTETQVTVSDSENKDN